MTEEGDGKFHLPATVDAVAISVYMVTLRKDSFCFFSVFVHVFGFSVIGYHWRGVRGVNFSPPTNLAIWQRLYIRRY